MEKLLPRATQCPCLRCLLLFGHNSFWNTGSVRRSLKLWSGDRQSLKKRNQSGQISREISKTHTLMDNVTVISLKLNVINDKSIQLL